MKKALFSLLLLSTATLHAGKFSDAVNGLLPDDIQDSKQFQAWHSQMAQQFKERAERALLLHDQLERFFGPYARKGSDEMRQVANAMCDFAEKKAQRKDFQKILFEGLQEKDFKKKNEWEPSRRPVGAGMQNAETAFGRHAAFLRKIKDASAEIEVFQKEIQQIKSQETQWDQKLENCHKKTKNLEEKRRDLETVEKENAPVLENLQAKITEQKDLLSQAEETRKKLAQEIDQVQINKTEDETLEDEQEAIHQKINQYKKEIENLEEQKQLPEQNQKSILTRREEIEDALKENAQEVIELTTQKQENRDKLQTINLQIDSWKLEKEKIQKEADAYALIKHFTFLNLGEGLPNENWVPVYCDNDDQVSLFSEASVPVLISVFKDTIGKIVQEETENLKSKTETTLIQEKIFEQVISKTISLKCNVADDLKRKLQNACLQTIGNACKENAAKFNKTLKTKVPDFIKMDDSLKAHKVFNQKAKHWKEKVNVHKDSVVQHFGLDCAFFNDAIYPLNHNTMLSFGQFKGLFKPNELETFAENGKEKNVWAFGSVQLKLNFFNQAAASSLPSQISRLIHFVEQKMASRSKDSGHVSFEARVSPSSTASSARRTAPLQEIHKAYFKYLGYRNMHYVLYFDVKGDKIPASLQVIDPDLNVLLKESLSEHNRLENVLAGKAFKWGQRVINHGQEFIKAEALEAHTFSPSLEKAEI